MTESQEAVADRHEPVSIEDTFTLAKDTVFRDLNDEAVILHLGSGTYFKMNPVGTRIWQLIERHGRLDAVLEALCQEYEASRDELQRAAPTDNR